MQEKSFADSTMKLARRFLFVCDYKVKPASSDTADLSLLQLLDGSKFINMFDIYGNPITGSGLPN